MDCWTERASRQQHDLMYKVTQQGIQACSTIQDKLGSLCLLIPLCSVRHPTQEYDTAAASPTPVNIQQLQQNYNSSKAAECQEILGKQAEHKAPFHLSTTFQDKSDIW